jgi:hypothetical protein
MRIADCVVNADVRILQAIARRHQLHCPLYSKHELIQAILYAFQSPTFVETKLRESKQWEHPAWMRIAFSPNIKFPSEEVYALFQVQGFRDVAFQEVLSEGWIYPVCGRFGETFFAIPSELQMPMRHAIVDFLRSKLSYREDDPPVFHEEELCIIRDLSVFLAYVRNHEVLLTTTGSMYKRSVLKLLELFEIAEDLPEETWRFGYGRRFHDYPDRLALIYDFAYHHGLIVEENGGKLCTTSAADAWESIPPKERQRRIFQFYIRVYRRPLPRLPLIVKVLIDVAETWVTSDTVLDALRPYVQSFHYDTVEDVWERRIVKMLRHLGVLRVAEKSSNDYAAQWFQISKLGLQLLLGDAALADDTERGDRILLVQPNFEILVTAANHPFMVELGRFTELKESGSLSTFRMTENRVRESLEQGHDLLRWMDQLASFSNNALPGNVESMLKYWARLYGSTATEERSDIETSPAETQ